MNLVALVRAPRFAIAGLLVLLTAGLLALPPEALGAESVPRTGFEERNGESWTTLEEEAAFLHAVDAQSHRVGLTELGESVEGRPLRLVRLGHPAPQPAPAVDQVALIVCSQHGNEPAGRETCLTWLRELAFTESPELVALLREWTVLFVPTANPDGRAADVRENARGVDINRDHLTLESPEARAIARVLRTWDPDLVLDLHEIPADRPEVNRVIFDDDVYYLWPRNLNVDPQIYSLSKSLAEDHIGAGEGYSADQAEGTRHSSDEYGQFAVAEQNLYQYAGDADPGIFRNLAGLRAAVSVLIESNATPNPQRPEELVDDAAVKRRRVASQVQNVADTFGFLRSHGNLVAAASAGALQRYAEQGRDRDVPVYFGGADNEEPEPSEVVFPPPCAYRLTADEAADIGYRMQLLEIESVRSGEHVVAPLAQPAEPLIPLLLDARSQRNLVAGEPLDAC